MLNYKHETRQIQTHIGLTKRIMFRDYNFAFILTFAFLELWLIQYMDCEQFLPRDAIAY